ncbi:MAG TPA: DUF2157 domain-containing protein [Burkholderiales bacterium]|nr:DUF2157 domain-containing protein [Burkholderiales bacterium]
MMSMDKKSRRHVLLDWAEQGRIDPGNLERAFAVAGVFPAGQRWLRFLDRLMLWLGALLIAAGIVFFLAYNWNDLGRYAKFGLVELLVVAALAVIWRTGIDSIAGKVALLAAALFVGALLALVGQTYQTGADTWELFSAWAVLILPWTLLGRLSALWLLWLGLLNAAVVFYYSIFGGLFGVLFAPDQLMWVLFALNAVALAAWEGLARGRASDRWAIRILATASGGVATALAIYAIVDFRHEGGWGALAWILYLAAAYALYRRLFIDVYVLAGGVLSVIVVVTTWLSMHLFRSAEAGAFLLIGMLIIGLSAAGGWWLKRIAAEARA